MVSYVVIRSKSHTYVGDEVNGRHFAHTCIRKEAVLTFVEYLECAR